MSAAITFGVLFVAGILALVHSIRVGVDVPDIAAQTGTVIGLAFAFLGALAKTNFKVYLLWQRIRLRFDTAGACKLSVTARFDGDFDPRCIAQICEYIGDKSKFARPARIERQNEQSALVSISNNLYVTLAFETAELAFDSRSHIQIATSVLELPPRFAVNKIDSQILPLLSAVRAFLGADSTAYQLDLFFERHNPFFAVYISHLQQVAVSDFRVLLIVPTPQVGKSDKIEIKKESVTIQTGTPESISRLARDFISLNLNTNSVG